jgi:Uma2 family endonuclease
VGAANPEAVLELEADGTRIEMTPTGGRTGARSATLLFFCMPGPVPQVIGRSSTWRGSRR